MMTTAELKKAMEVYGESLDDVISICSVREGLVEAGDNMPEDIYVFTTRFVYIVVIYDGMQWFEGVPRDATTAQSLEYYGDFGG